MARKAKSKQDRENPLYCQFCDSVYVKESSFMVHRCPGKIKWLQKDEMHVKLGFYAYNRYYEMTRKVKKKKTYEDFMKSQYYHAFVRLGRFVRNNNVISPEDFIEFLIKTSVPLDDWDKDYVYETYVREQIKKETPDKAFERFILLAESWGNAEEKPWVSIFREIEPNQAVQWIKSGRISPWIIFTASSSSELFNRLNEEQTQIVVKAVDDRFWQKKLEQNKQEISYLRDLCNEVGL